MRIADDIAGGQFVGADRRALEQPARRAGAVAGERRFRDEVHGLFPEFQPQSDRRGRVGVLVEAILLHKTVDGRAQLG